MAAVAGAAAGAAGGSGAAGGAGGNAFNINGNNFSIGGMGGGQGGSGGGGGNFMNDVIKAEADTWTKYINAATQQQQAVLPTQAQPAPPPKQTAPAVKPTPQPQDADQQPTVVVVEKTVQDPAAPTGAAFNGYVQASQQANDQKKKQANNSTGPTIL